MKQFRPSLALILALLMTVCLLAGCGNKPEPDPGQDNDVSTGVSQDDDVRVEDDTTDTTDEGADATDETGDSTDESADATDESGDATDGSSDTTTGDGRVTTTQKGETTKATVKTTTKKGETTKTTVKTTTKRGETTKTTVKTSTKTTTTKSTTKTTTKVTTTKNSGGIIVDKTTTTTKKTSATSVTTSHQMDKTVKQQILDIFDASMKGKTVTVLSGWTQGTDEKQKMDELIAATGIKVKWIVAEGDGYATRLSALINATASPDLAMLNCSGYPSMVIKNFFQDLSTTGIDTTSSIFDQQLLDAFTWDGKQYALTLKNSEYSGLFFTFYNKSLFKKLGVTDPGTLWKQGNWNWDTFLECAQQTVDMENGRLGAEFYATDNFLLTSGISIVTVEDGNIVNNLKDPRITEVWTFINKLHHEYKVTSAATNAETNFANGNCAMLLGESWQANAGGTICNQTTDEWGVVPYPAKKELGNIAPITPCGGAIPIGAKYPKAGAGVWAYWCSYDTGMLGSGKAEGTTGAYSRDEINDVKRAMWDYTKVPDMGQGVLEYGGEYSRWDFGYDIFLAGMSGINTNVDKWSSALDVNIKRIMTEFS
ncbi:MAG: extracellular solute-binding protein [Clostridia bacterium]|nr:extracellular solute-binding protein [Clostridia bacterium]